MTTITLIDAHGSDHGLRVEVDTGQHTVTIVQWGELCEPSPAGNFMPHTQTRTMSLRVCLEYAAKDGRRTDSQRDRVITGALHYLSYHGGTEERFDEGTRPCDHFAYDPKVRCDACHRARPTLVLHAAGGHFIGAREWHNESWLPEGATPRSRAWWRAWARREGYKLREHRPSRFTQIFADHALPPLPDTASVLDMRWQAGTGDWWAKTEAGWYWLRGDIKKEWKAAPMGPPGERP